MSGVTPSSESEYRPVAETMVLAGWDMSLSERSAATVDYRIETLMAVIVVVGWSMRHARPI